jgi:hypothetical protein
MAKRGRQSEADAAVVVEGSFGRRPEPPSDLTEDQAEIWKAVVASEPIDYFKTAALRGLLVDYCRHRASADLVTTAIDLFTQEWLRSAEGAKRYHQLLRMRDLSIRAASDIATKLRLTNQSRYTPQAAATASRNAVSGPKPWDL